MSLDVRAGLIRLAATMPKGSDERVRILDILKTGMEFPTQDALRKYLKDHPGADKSKHKVKKTEPKKAPKEALKRDSDAYFAEHVSGSISKKKLSDALKGSGWKPRGKGSYDKKRKFVELLVDPPEGSREMPVRVVFSGSHYTSGDGQGGVYLYKGNTEWNSDVFDMKGDPEKDAETMLKSLGDIMEDYNKQVEMNKKNKKASDLRSRLIRLAHENPSLRSRILPLLKEAGRRDDPNRVVFKVVSQLGGVTHEMAIINMTAGNKKIPFDGTPEDLARTLQEAASTSLRFQSMDFLDGPEINVVKAPRVPEALAQRAIAQATVVVGAMFVALRGTSSGLEWTLLPRAPRMAATPRTAHGPVDLKNPDAMYYEIDPSTNKSKFYEFKIVPIGQESDRTASGNSVKVAGDPNTAAFVLMRRWGRLTDTGFSGRVDGYNEYWSSRNMAERSMYEQGRKRVSHGYTDVSGKREYPIGLGAAGFGWGGQAACRVIPELSQMKDAMKNALKTVSGADRWLAPVARQDSSMARKLQGLLAEVERSLSTVDTYLDEQMSYCR